MSQARQAHARRPRAEEASRERPRALRAVPAPADRPLPAGRARRNGRPRQRTRLDAPDLPAEPLTIQVGVRTTEPQRRARPRRAPAVGPRPDRLAAWAVVLCLLMALVAGATAGGDDERTAAPAVPESIR